MPTKHQRINQFFRRIEESSPQQSPEDAHSLLVILLKSVEDEYHGDGDGQGPLSPEGRMEIPLLEDFTLIPGTQVRCFEAFRHAVYLGPNGSIEVRLLINKKPVAHLPGKDGKSMADFYHPSQTM